MKSDNLLLWANGLRTTGERQGHGGLHYRVYENGTWVDEFCCLGFGCKIAGIDRRIPEWNNQPYFPLEPTVGAKLAVSYEDATELPPDSFHLWLGFTEDDVAYLNDHDLFLDSGDIAYQDENSTREFPLRNVGLATMNDGWGLTFKQIGDLVAYFGVTLDTRNV